MDNLMHNSELATVVERLAKHRAGERKFGVYSVCSAHEAVLKTALHFAARQGSPLLLESTSNQVNHLGGYTGMKPTDFTAFVRKLASQAGYPLEKLIFGGDHLGPYPWHKLTAAEAMAQARQTLAAYVRAGYQKIHIDTTTPCQDDPSPLPLELIVARSEELCQVAEKAAAEVGTRPYYVFGSEVPPPGGAQGSEEMQLTSAAELAQTVETFHAQLGHLWPRVMGFVTQPGVEFDGERVHSYQPLAAAELSAALTTLPGRWVFEAHSTDYQSQLSLAALVHDHFAILKVGPELTFAYREALFALAMVEKELYSAGKIAACSDLINRVCAAVRADDRHWADHYHGSRAQIEVAIRYSLSDRIRYYWQQPEVAATVEELHRNLAGVELPYSLLSQFFPGSEPAAPELQVGQLIRARIEAVLSKYHLACGGSGGARKN